MCCLKLYYELLHTFNLWFANQSISNKASLAHTCVTSIHIGTVRIVTTWTQLFTFIDIWFIMVKRYDIINVQVWNYPNSFVAMPINSGMTCHVILLSMKMAPVSSLSLSCLPESSDVKKVSPAESRVVEEVAKTS